MPALHEDLQALINAPGAVTKTQLVSLLKKQPKTTVENASELLAFGIGAVFGSEQGGIFVKENGPGEDGFSAAGDAATHSAEDITLPATVLSDGNW